MLDTMKAFPGVFSGIAVIDDNAPRPQDEMRRLKSLGLVAGIIRLGIRRHQNLTQSDRLRLLHLALMRVVILLNIVLAGGES